jgi:hypothetical protein
MVFHHARDIAVYFDDAAVLPFAAEAVVAFGTGIERSQTQFLR